MDRSGVLKQLLPKGLSWWDAYARITKSASGDCSDASSRDHARSRACSRVDERCSGVGLVRCWIGRRGNSAIPDGAENMRGTSFLSSGRDAGVLFRWGFVVRGDGLRAWARRWLAGALEAE